MMKYTEEPSEKNLDKNKDTVKLSTVVFFVLGLLVPFWLVTLPLCWFIAYRTFKSGDGNPIFVTSPKLQKDTNNEQQSNSRLDDIERLKALFDSGALTEEEYQTEKAKILDR